MKAFSGNPLISPAHALAIDTAADPAVIVMTMRMVIVVVATAAITFGCLGSQPPLKIATFLCPRARGPRSGVYCMASAGQVELLWLRSVPRRGCDILQFSFWEGCHQGSSGRRFASVSFVDSLTPPFRLANTTDATTLREA